MKNEMQKNSNTGESILLFNNMCARLGKGVTWAPKSKLILLLKLNFDNSFFSLIKKNMIFQCKTRSFKLFK